jgi:hypothetical protein
MLDENKGPFCLTKETILDYLGASGIHGIFNDSLKFSWLPDCRCCNNGVIFGEM